MKAAFIVLCLSCIAVPCHAQVYLELGNWPVVSFQWEKPSFALGFGTSVTWVSLHGRPGGERSDLIVLSPTLNGQLFLNADPKARSFVELQVAKGVPIFPSGASFAKQTNDDWTFAPGVGLRSAVADRLNLGGAAGYALTLRTVDGFPDDIASGTFFRAFLQYHL